MENGKFAPQKKCSIFHNIFQNLTFQRHPKALVWSKGLTPGLTLRLTKGLKGEQRLSGRALDS